MPKRDRWAVVEARLQEAKKLDKQVELGKVSAGSDWSPDLRTSTLGLGSPASNLPTDGEKMARAETLRQKAAETLSDLLSADKVVRRR